MFLDMLMMGEPRRLDYIIREHEKLRQQVEALTALLVENGVVSADALSRSARGAPATESGTSE